MGNVFGGFLQGALGPGGFGQQLQQQQFGLLVDSTTGGGITASSYRITTADSSVAQPEAAPPEAPKKGPALAWLDERIEEICVKL